MNAKVSQIAARIALRLDVSIVFEALILNRLAQISVQRREEWLRGLLVRGFQSECAALRTPTRADGALIHEPSQRYIAIEHLEPVAISDAGTPANSTDNVVSLAALQKVIG